MAIQHLDKFLALAPLAPEAPQVRQLLNMLRRSWSGDMYRLGTCPQVGGGARRPASPASAVRRGAEKEGTRTKSTCPHPKSARPLT